MAKNIVEYILTLKDRNFTAGLKKAALQVKNVDNRTKALNQNISGLGVGIAGLVIGYGALKAVNIAGEFEQTGIAFETMLGSVEKGQKLLKELDVFATKTPFSIQGVQSSAKQLLAMGIEADRLLPTLKSLGDVSSGLSVPISRLALNFGQVRSQGKLTGRELRDFAIAGVPLMSELAKQLNVSTAQIQKMVSAGKIGFPEVEQAFTNMSSKGGKFFNLMDRQNKTFLGGVNEMKENIQILARNIGNTLIPMLKPLVSSIARFTKFAKRNKTAVEIWTKILVVFITVIGSVVIAIKLWSAAQAILNILLLANPVGLVVVAIALLIGIIAAVVTSVKGWGTQWKIVMRIFNLTLKLWKTNWMIIWKFISNNYMGVLDRMKIAWLKFKQALGFGSEGDKNIMKSLQDGIIKRRDELINLANEGHRTAKQLKNSFNFTLTFGDDLKKQVKIGKSTVSNLGESIKKERFNFPFINETKKKILGLGDDTKIKSETTVTSAAPKVFNINIDKLVETFNVNTQNVKEAPGKVKDMIQQALLEALADIEIAR